jgi:hypothetical protein
MSTNRSERFANYVHEFSQKIMSPDAELKNVLDAVDKEIRQKVSTPGAVTRTQLLDNLAVAYSNEEFIGRQLAPVVSLTPDKGLSPEYWKYDKANKFSYPSDEVGTTGAVNIVSEKVSRTSVSLTRRALKEFSDTWVTSMQDPVVSRLIAPMVNVLHGLAFQEEQRIATLMCAYGNYANSLAALTGGDTWDSSTGGDPAGVIDTAKDAIWSGTGPSKLVMFTSPKIHRVLKRHPQILDSIKYGGNGSSPVIATKRALAEFFEVDDYVVGGAKYNSANEGQTASYGNMWSDVVGLVRVSTAPTTNTATFAYTLQQMLESTTWYEQGLGGRGGSWVQGSLADQSLVVCSDCGYLCRGVLT